MELARGAGAALVDRLAGTTFNWAQPYHDIANDVTQLLVRYCSVPVAAAPALALTAVLFIPLFFSAALFLSTWGYHGHPRWEMASAVPSFVHGCVTSVMAAVLACRHLRDDGGLVPTAANTAADVLVLQFSCAYFLEDLFIYVGLFARHEALFALHHVAVLTYMAICIRLGFGANTAFIGVAMGELTSPLQNVWFLLKNARYDFKWADRVFAPLSWVYSAFYVLCRSVVGPLLIGWDAWAVARADALPIGLRALFVTILVGGVAASQGWSAKLSKRIFQSYRPAYGTKTMLRTDEPSASNGSTSNATNGDSKKTQ